MTDSVATFPRGNLDTVTNSYGDSLISLCKNVPLRICNSRKLGDTQGSFTCHKWNCQRAVDYCLSTPRLFGKILSFNVGNFLPLLSDHCPITIAIKCRIYQLYNKNEDYEFIPKPTKLSWDSNIALNFENIIQSNESKNFLKNFVINGIAVDQKSVDCTTEFITEFLVSSAEKAANNGISITFRGGGRRGHLGIGSFEKNRTGKF